MDDDAPALRLLVETGPDAGLAFDVPDEHERAFVIGRGIDAHARLLRDAAVSARHAAILRAGPAHYVLDLGSRNGTRRGDETVGPSVGTRIHPGDVLLLGSTRLRVVRREAVDGEAIDP